MSARDMEAITGPRRPLAATADGRIDATRIDLGGVAGVSPTEQARAEALLKRTVERLPAWADRRHALASGFFSIGDESRGYEHLVNLVYMNDQEVLNPDRPESLLYRVGPNGAHELVAAMYFLLPGTTFASVPDLGGRLTQFHIHGLLCLKPGSLHGAQIRSDGSCPPGTSRPKDRVPMIHVWIVPNRCGPFAALTDAGGGEVQPDELVHCDRVHGT
ncbi:MAG: hypothetical protein ABJC79_06545 [Acidimicrobiia bacterium]